MKKLLFITWSVSFGYGTEKSLADVLNRLDSHEYDISVLPMFKYSCNNIFNGNIRVLDAIVDYTREDFDEKQMMRHYYELLASPVKFNKLITDRYDCVIACNHNAPSYFASYIKGGAKAVWIRGDMRELDYRELKPDTDQYRQVKQEYEMQKNVFGCFDVIAVISEVAERTLSELFGITENVYRVSNSVDHEKIKRLSNESVRLPGKKLFTTLGRLDYNKNHILLLKAVKELRKQRSDFMVYILGDGDERKRLEEYIRENGLESCVRILGFIDNPYPYIKNSIATVLTSLGEGFCLALVESVALNTPIISTDVGVAKELVEKYRCGEIIDYNERDLAAAMIRYLNKYDGCKKPFNIGNEFDLKTEVNKTAALIEKAIETACGNQKIKKLPYPEYTIDVCELEGFEICRSYMYVLRVIKDGVPYEYLINRNQHSKKLIVFNNGAVAGGNVTVPVFQRHSWAKLLKTSSIFCMDPTLYLNGLLQVGWGIGKNENYYLENSSLILKRIIGKMGIELKNTVIYGTSAGGYLSIMMGIYLKGTTVVADNAQLDVRNWIFKDALDSALSFCFDNMGEALNHMERFSVIEAFEKHGYVPKTYMHVNLCSRADNSTQLVPFLEAAEHMHCIKEYNGIEVILHFEREKGHDGLGMEESIDFLYETLGEKCPERCEK